MIISYQSLFLLKQQDVTLESGQAMNIISLGMVLALKKRLIIADIEAKY
jgi:hypothetical protein